MNSAIRNTPLRPFCDGWSLLDSWGKKQGGGFISTKKQDSQYQATLKTDLGDIVLEFFPDVAPRHVESFLTLAKKGFYNGLTFHRIIPGFMMQGGCPLGTGTGGPGYTLPAEFNDKPHQRGTLSMARSRDPDSAGSQFFICFDRAPHLDGQYTVFGQVIEGIEVVQAVEKVKLDASDRPLKPLRIREILLKEVTIP